jgi:hypothetical protein
MVFSRVRVAIVELLIGGAPGVFPRRSARSSGPARADAYLRENFTLAGAGGRIMRVRDRLKRPPLEARPAG